MSGERRDWVLTGKWWAGLRDAIEQELRQKSDPPDNSYDQGYGDALRWVLERMSGEQYDGEADRG